MAGREFPMVREEHKTGHPRFRFYGPGSPTPPPPRNRRLKQTHKSPVLRVGTAGRSGAPARRERRSAPARGP